MVALPLAWLGGTLDAADVAGETREPPAASGPPVRLHLHPPRTRSAAAATTVVDVPAAGPARGDDGADDARARLVPAHRGRRPAQLPPVSRRSDSPCLDPTPPCSFATSPQPSPWRSRTGRERAWPRPRGAAGRVHHGDRVRTCVHHGLSPGPRGARNGRGRVVERELPRGGSRARDRRPESGPRTTPSPLARRGYRLRLPGQLWIRAGESGHLLRRSRGRARCGSSWGSAMEGSSPSRRLGFALGATLWPTRARTADGAGLARARGLAALVWHALHAQDTDGRRLP